MHMDTNRLFSVKIQAKCLYACKSLAYQNTNIYQGENHMYITGIYIYQEETHMYIMGRSVGKSQLYHMHVRYMHGKTCMVKQLEVVS